jgi:mannose/fructose/N-acetylgalactosamine-specific phosphotransferase system component IID
MVARAAPRAAYVGGPLTPTGYAILAMTVAAVAMVMMLSTSSVGNELGRALRLSWWFS